MIHLQRVVRLIRLTIFYPMLWYVCNILAGSRYLYQYVPQAFYTFLQCLHINISPHFSILLRLLGGFVISLVILSASSGPLSASF